MFGGGQANPYDEIVVKATDENLTSENWEIILNLCDKVDDEGEEGARNVIAALLKRLAHRTSNVQLYALSLAESLSKNCGKTLHREIASKAFTQGLERIITDRTTHDKVRKRALALIAEWAEMFEDDETLGIMEECYNSLKAKNYKFSQPSEPPPPQVDDDIRRKEEEELQRVLELSMQDKGGRPSWAEAYSPAASGSTGATSTAAPSSSSAAYQAPKYTGGYVPAPAPARTPSPKTASPTAQTFAASGHGNPSVAAGSTAVPFANTSISTYQASPPTSHTAPSVASTATSAEGAQGATGIVTRVLALHTFNPTEPGELAFEKGDIIKVVDRGYKDWWRGQVRGRTGIFPVNYVEPLPEPTPAEIAREAQAEADVFGQAVNVERLLNMLRAMDPEKDSLADNEEVQELYRSCMALRPKIVKLIDKYSQKRADLVSMNETFVRARTIFDRMMEESLARHTGVYDPQPSFRPQPSYNLPHLQHQQHQPRPDSRGTWGSPAPQQGYGNVPPPQGFPAPQPAPYPGAPGPEVYGPQPASAYQQQQTQPGYGPPGQAPPQQQQQQQQPVYQQPPAQQQQQQQPPYQQTPVQQQPPQQQQQQQQPTPYQQPPVQQQQSPQQPQQQQLPAQQQQQQPVTGAGPVYGTQAGYVVNQQQPYGPQGPVIYPEQQQPQQQQPQQTAQPQQQPPVQQQPIQPQQVSPQVTSPQPQAQPQGQPQVQPSPQAQTQPLQPIITQQQPVQQVQPAQAQPQTQPQQQPQPQQQHHQAQPAQQQGPPYVYDPNTTYADPNVQAWAQYYAKGGKDPQGSVYFVSVPGVKEGPAAPAPATASSPVAGGSGAGNAAAAPAGPNASTSNVIQHQPPQQQQLQDHQQRPSAVSQSSIDSLPYPGDYASPQPAPSGATGLGGHNSFAANTFGVGLGTFTSEPQSQAAGEQHPYGQQQQQSHGYGTGYQLKDPGAATSQSSLPLPGGATSQSSLPLPGTTGPESKVGHGPGPASSSQPSWLLPKRDGAGGTNGLSNQFAGMSVGGSDLT